MAKLYDDRGYASARLDGTIVTYRGRAMFVNGVDGRLDLHGRIILTGDEVVVDQEDPELCMSSPQVGYVNVQGDSHYFMRQPLRRWKQGVDMRALVCPTSGMRARGSLNDVALAKCIENSYPTLEQALDSFGSRNPFKDVERRGMAFHRNFCVRKGEKGPLLLYKGREVGVVEGGTPVLATKYHWLTETLEELL